MPTAEELRARYSRLADDELVELAARPQDLTPDGLAALAAEMRERGLTPLELPPPSAEEPRTRRAEPSRTRPVDETTKSSAVKTPQAVLQAATPPSGHSMLMAVEVVNIRMSFWAMVVFMVKWVIAAIPAAIILFALFFATGMLFRGLLAELLSQLG